MKHQCLLFFPLSFSIILVNVGTHVDDPIERLPVGFFPSVEEGIQGSLHAGQVLLHWTSVRFFLYFNIGTLTCDPLPQPPK